MDGLVAVFGIILGMFGLGISILHYEISRITFRYNLFEHRQSVYHQVSSLIEGMDCGAYGTDADNESLRRKTEEFENAARLVEQIFSEEAKEHADRYISCLRSIEEINYRYNQKAGRLKEIEAELGDEAWKTDEWQSLNNETLMYGYELRGPMQGMPYISRDLMNEMARHMKISEPRSTGYIVSFLFVWVGSKVLNFYSRAGNYLYYDLWYLKYRDCWHRSRLGQLVEKHRR